MKKKAFFLPCILWLASCGDNAHKCVCTDKGNDNAAIADYKLQGKKESAAFECKQKSLQYSGPQYKDVQCALQDE